GGGPHHGGVRGPGPRVAGCLPVAAPGSSLAARDHARATEGRMLIQVINPNASRAMSELICEQLTRVKGANTKLEVVNPPGAPAAIESALDEAQTIPPMLEIVRAAAEQGIDAIVIACFSDP